MPQKSRGGKGGDDVFVIVDDDDDDVGQRVHNDMSTIRGESTFGKEGVVDVNKKKKKKKNV